MTSERTGRRAAQAAEAPSRKPAGRGRDLPARSGRRPGDSGTKEQILGAALGLFASKGYGGTTIRGIAEQAEVDPALVHHFFSNKDGVFRAAIESTLTTSSILDSMPASGEPGTGADAGTEALRANPALWYARAYLSYWEDPTTGPAMIAIYRTGLADESSSDLVQARFQATTANFKEVTGCQDSPETDVVMALAAAHLAGLCVIRHVLRLEPLASMPFEDFLGRSIPVLERYFADLDL
ncbi:TetR family transcriptional regulator [Streptacidiphilus sp. EB129]|uniref:TetR/AcrR family transcriptional regulator n=1 Tax=Streptacidiphilus sp. EB129 TaxID=3156262 RepID=UPI003513C52D